MAAIVVGLVALLAAPAFAAGTGYAPPGPPSTLPGGFTKVVISQTVSTAGGTVRTAYDSARLAVFIPPHEFPETVQMSVTAPTLSEIPGAVIGFELTFIFRGKPVLKTYSKPVTFSIESRAIREDDVVKIWSDGRWATYPDATISDGSARIVLTRDSVFVLYRRVR